MSTHQDLLAATLAAWVLWGAAVGLLIGSRRASRGKMSLNAPVSDDQAARLKRVGNSFLPAARVGSVVMGVLFVVLLICFFAT